MAASAFPRLARFRRFPLLAQFPRLFSCPRFSLLLLLATPPRRDREGAALPLDHLSHSRHGDAALADVAPVRYYCQIGSVMLSSEVPQHGVLYKLIHCFQREYLPTCSQQQLFHVLAAHAESTASNARNYLEFGFAGSLTFDA